MADKKPKNTYTFWSLLDDGGFWRVDGMIYNADANRSVQTFAFNQSFPKSEFKTDHVGEIMARAEAYQADLFKNDPLLALWMDQ